MASIYTESNGRKAIQFAGSDGKRRTIRLGSVSMRQAEAVKSRVEDLAHAALTGGAPRPETSAWLGGLDDVMHRRLAAVGLVKPRGSATLGQFTRDYIDGRADIKPRTKINLERARTYLLAHFPADKPLRDFTAGDADDFRQALIRSGKAENTIRRALGRSRQFFVAAQRRGLVTSNPFDGVAVSVRATTERFRFVSRTDIDKVIDACPDVEWKLIVALARHGGLRCPSEVLALRWQDINWEHGRFTVHSSKTEHQGKASRVVPLFPELLPHLQAAFDAADDGAVHCVTRYRSSAVNLRTQLHRLIRKAGLEPWPKTFQNLRSTRETELADEYPLHVVVAWLGNSQPVAAKHYLQVTDEHFRQAAECSALQNPMQQVHAGQREVGKGEGVKPRSQGEKHGDALVCATVPDGGMPWEGLEPSTR